MWWLWPTNAMLPLTDYDVSTFTWFSTTPTSLGGDFNMSACSIVGDVFTDPELAALGNSLLWELGALDDSCRERTAFLVIPQRPYEWRVDSHGCHKFNNADLAPGPRDTTAHFPLSLHLRTTNFPGPDSISSAVSKLSGNAWNEKQASMNVGKAAGNLHSLQHPDLPVPSLRENMACVSFPWRLLTRGSPTAYCRLRQCLH